ncbi:hypothetical protein [Pontibacter populi]|uniref:YARHG domain-containing protein n=1 Tax=Pontibacter populi TaxID=890055 RepID=A0ABV1RUU0_9BACT
MSQVLFFAVKFVLVLSLAFYPNVAPAETHLSSYSLQNTVYQQDENPLFTNEEILEIKLSMDYGALLKDRGEDSKYHPAILSYTDSNGLVTVMNLKAKVRGNRRRDPSVCAFPPLLLNFVRKTSGQTIFNKVNKVKLVTHCINEDYVIREFLVYKLYNVLTNYSFRVKLCRVTYEDLKSKRKTEKRYAFMIEDDSEMAKRNNSELVKKELVINMRETDEEAMALLAFFQYMIGNTDWSVPYRHNIELMATDPLSPAIPVTYDFDYAGIVDAPYASPPPELNITSVRQRLFRGYSYSPNTLRKTINTFNARRTSIYGLYKQEYDLLDKSYLKRTMKYLDEFYETINDPKRLDKKINKVGQKNQEKYVVVKGLE